MLRELSCPKCGAPGLQANQPDGVVMCSFCGNTFAADNSIACPHCETINPPDFGFCKACGEKLKSNCPACGEQNWAGAEYCTRCGRNLSAVTALAERHSQGFRGVLKQQRETANALKQGDEAQSKKRLGLMWDKEAERQAHLTSQRAEQERQQSKLLTIVISLAVVFLVIALLFVFFLIAR